ADVVAEVVRGGYPSVDVEKVYTGAYPAVVTAAGRRIPEAAADIERILEEGTLIWNYSGHGGPEGLSDERVFTNEDVEHLDNFDRLTVFVTATCSFGRYDMVERRSGAELLLAKPDGGAVALLTTHRVVYTDDDTASLNLGLNLRLTREMLERDADGRPRRLVDALRLTKNTDVGAQERRAAGQRAGRGPRAGAHARRPARPRLRRGGRGRRLRRRARGRARPRALLLLHGRLLHRAHGPDLPGPGHRPRRPVRGPL